MLDEGAQGDQWEEMMINRARLNVQGRPLGDLEFRLTPEFLGTWGGNTVLRAHEAWMSWRPSETASLYIGRQKLRYGNNMVIAHRDWSNSAPSYDALRLRVHYDYGHTDLIYFKEDTGLGTINHDVLGFYSTINLDQFTLFADTLDVYALWNNDRVEAGDDEERDRTVVTGLRLAGYINTIDYNVEGTGQFGYRGGDDDLLNEYSAEAEVGFHLMDYHRVGLYGGYASEEYQNYWGEQHNVFGIADIVGRQNVLAIAGKGNVHINDEFALDLAAWYFMHPHEDTAFGGTGMGAGDDDLGAGFEGDVVMSYLPNANLSFDLGYSYFQPIGVLDDVNALDDPIQRIYAQTALSF